MNMRSQTRLRRLYSKNCPMAMRQKWSPAINRENYLFQGRSSYIIFSTLSCLCQFFHQHNYAKISVNNLRNIYFFPICISTKNNRDTTETNRLRFPLLTEMRKVNVLYVHSVSLPIFRVFGNYSGYSTDAFGQITFSFKCPLNECNTNRCIIFYKTTLQ